MKLDIESLNCDIKGQNNGIKRNIWNNRWNHLLRKPQFEIKDQNNFFFIEEVTWNSEIKKSNFVVLSHIFDCGK